MTDDGDDHTDKKKTEGKCPATAHAARVDDHDSDSEPEHDTTEHQGLNEHGESSHDADNNPSFDEGPNDDPEDELEPWVNSTQYEQRTKLTTC